MYIVSLLITNRQPAVFGHPRQCPLHDPPVVSQLFGALQTLSGYAVLDASFSQSSRTLFTVVGFVGMQFLGSLPRPAARTLDRLDAVYKVLEDHRVMYLRGSEHHCERDAVSVDHKEVALRARLSLIRRIRAGTSCSPLLAGTLAESKETRSHSICSASPRRSKRTRCSFSHTPASCHSFKRRQQVTPLPQPISCGSISHRGCRRTLARRQCL